jgi:hypothetical protein
MSFLKKLIDNQHVQTFLCEVFILAMIKRINVFDPLIAEMHVINKPTFNEQFHRVPTSTKSD